jgi:hypothetical protein
MDVFKVRESLTTYKGIDQTNLEKKALTNVGNNIYRLKMTTTGYTPLCDMILEYKKNFTIYKATSEILDKTEYNYATFAQPSFSWLMNLGYIDIKIGDSFESVQDEELNKNVTYKQAYRQLKRRSFIDQILMSRYGLREINTQQINPNQTSDNTLTMNAGAAYFNSNMQIDIGPYQSNTQSTFLTKTFAVPLSEIDPFFDSETCLPPNTRIEINIDSTTQSRNPVFYANNNLSIYPTAGAPTSMNIIYKRIIIESPYVGLTLTNHFNTFGFKVWTLPYVNPYRLSLTIDIKYYTPLELNFFLKNDTSTQGQSQIINNISYILWQKQPCYGFFLSEFKVTYENEIREPLQLTIDNNDYDTFTNSPSWNNNNMNSFQQMKNSVKFGWDNIVDSPYVLDKYKPLSINLQKYTRDMSTLNNSKYLKISFLTTPGPWNESTLGSRELVVMTRYSKKFCINGRNVKLQTEAF